MFPLGRPYVVPSDRLGHEVARLLIEPSATRDRLTAGMYLGRARRTIRVAEIERALAATIAAEPIEAKMRAAVKAGRVDAKLPPGAGVEVLVARAHERRRHHRGRGARRSLAARELTAKVIRVDDFAQDLGASEIWRGPGEAPPVTIASHCSAQGGA